MSQARISTCKETYEGQREALVGTHAKHKEKLLKEIAQIDEQLDRDILEITEKHTQECVHLSKIERSLIASVQAMRGDEDQKLLAFMESDDDSR